MCCDVPEESAEAMIDTTGGMTITVSTIASSTEYADADNGVVSFPAE